jgi:hypothetical protein
MVHKKIGARKTYFFLETRKKYFEMGTNNNFFCFLESLNIEVYVFIQVQYWSSPWAAAATGTGVEVENINERPLDCINNFQDLL